MIDLLKRLVEKPCVPQFQEKMIDFLKREVDFADVETDHLGNVHLTPEGSNGDGLALLSNLNEVGFVVEHIDDSGFLRFKNTSKVDERTLLSQRMMVYGRDGGVRGVVGSKPPHLLRGEEEAGKPVGIEDMFIDIGAYSRKQAEDMGIRIGDPIVFEGWLKELPDGRLASKALNNRAGCAVIIEALRDLLSEGAEGVSAWLLSQETSFPEDLSPDFALAVDTTLAGPYPPERVKVERHEIPVEVGDGPALTLREDDVSISQEVRKMLDKAAERAGIELQVEATSRADGRRVNPMQRGIPSAILSLPVKYLRTPREMASFSDLEEAVNVVEEFYKISMEGES